MKKAKSISLSSLISDSFCKLNKNITNRWHLSAEGFLLLPSALRPHLLGQKCKKYGFRDIFCDKIVSNYAKIHQKLQFSAKINEKLAKNTHFLAILALFQIVAASTIFGSLCSSPVSAASLTLTIPSSFSLDITPSANGTFVKSGSKSINVKTDNSSGYTLSIKAKNSENSNNLINSSISINNKLNSISEQTSEDSFKTDAKFNNSWGYLPSKFNSEDNTNFLPGPTTEESIIEATEEANNETGTDYNITLGAKVDNAVSSGNYNNAFIFSATSNEPKYDAIMQDWAGCASLPDDGNTTINLLDTRDNNIYKVAKLKDGKCWMVESLRLGDSKLSNRTLTSANTDITASTYQLTTRTAEKLNVNYNYDADALYIDPNHPEYGGYYSWHTATAGTGTAAMSSGNATSSICPKGWKLPTGGSDSSDFGALVTAYGGNNSTGSTNLRATPVPGFVYSGYVRNDGYGLDYQGSVGYYWSSTVYDATNACNLALTSSLAHPANRNNKYYGYSVRCVTEPKKTMQTVDQWGGDVKDDEVVEAIDARDGNTYTVSKLADGKLWMIQGLRITDKKISSADSDMSDEDGTFTVPESEIAKFVSSNNNNDAAYYNNDQDDGAYYTWHTATAGTGTASTAAYVDATSSICPKGWKLPKGGAAGSATSDFVTLAKAYGGTGNNGSGQKTAVTNLIASPVPHFTYAGNVDYSSGKLVNHGGYGYYWSRTAYSTTNAYYLYFDYSGRLDPAYNYYKRYGRSARCVYYPPKKITDLQYMQDWGDLSETEKTQVINSMQEETNYTLIDKRDNSEYTIAKLKDGKVWMTQNLRLINKTIDSTNSDMTSGSFSIPSSTNSGWNDSNYTSSMAYYGGNTNYGALYTRLIATAGTGTVSLSSGEAPSSICPKGWRLPTSAEMSTLTSTYSISQAQSAPANFGSSSWAGTCHLLGCPFDQGYGGYWWSSTAGGSDSSYYLTMNSNYFGVGTIVGGTGISVRCVGRE